MSVKNVATMWFYSAIPTLCFNTRRSVTTWQQNGSLIYSKKSIYGYKELMNIGVLELTYQCIPLTFLNQEQRQEFSQHGRLNQCVCRLCTLI